MYGLSAIGNLWGLKVDAGWKDSAGWLHAPEDRVWVFHLARILFLGWWTLAVSVFKMMWWGSHHAEHRSTGNAEHPPGGRARLSSEPESQREVVQPPRGDAQQPGYDAQQPGSETQQPGYDAQPPEDEARQFGNEAQQLAAEAHPLGPGAAQLAAFQITTDFFFLLSPVPLAIGLIFFIWSEAPLVVFIITVVIAFVTLIPWLWRLRRAAEAFSGDRDASVRMNIFDANQLVSLARDRDLESSRQNGA